MLEALAIEHLLPAAAAQPQMAQAAVVGVAQAVATSPMGPIDGDAGRTGLFRVKKRITVTVPGTVPYPWSTSTP